MPKDKYGGKRFKPKAYIAPPNKPAKKPGKKGDEHFGVNSESGEYTKWINSLDEKERKGMVTYTSNDFRKISDALRDPEKDWTKTSQADTIRSIDSAISKFELEENIIVYRCAGTHLMNGLTTAEDINRELKGAIVVDDGYMSTSTDRKTALFVGTNTRRKEMKKAKQEGRPPRPLILYEIRMRAGKGVGAYINPISAYKGQLEFVSMRGMHYEVKGAREEGGHVIVRLESKPNKKSRKNRKRKNNEKAKTA